jgi:hypothetical protein
LPSRNTGTGHSSNTAGHDRALATNEKKQDETGISSGLLAGMEKGLAFYIPRKGHQAFFAGMYIPKKKISGFFAGIIPRKSRQAFLPVLCFRVM